MELKFRKSGIHYAISIPCRTAFDTTENRIRHRLFPLAQFARDMPVNFLTAFVFPAGKIGPTHRIFSRGGIQASHEFVALPLMTAPQLSSADTV
jgi:hypothetical protein